MPLQATLARASTVEVGGKGLAVAFGAAASPTGPGWATPVDLASNPDLLDDLLRYAEGACGNADRAVSASLFLKGYLWRLLSPTVACFLLDRRLPVLGPRSVALRFDDEGSAAETSFLSPGFAALPEDPESGHPDAVVVPSEDALLDRMRDDLAGDHLPALFEALRPRARRSRTALWGMAVDACADAFAYVGQDLGREEEARARAEHLLSGSRPLSGPTNYFDAWEVPSSGAPRVRNTCCLYYKLGRNACASCPRVLLSVERRRSRSERGSTRRMGSEGGRQA